MTGDSKNALEDKQGWNEYWGQKKNSGGIVYDLIAQFYRKFIIRPSLNKFITTYFPRNGNVLHAGCGSGQVDADIRHYVNITGLDISPGALEIYRRENKDLCKTMHGSIFQIPAEANTYDGIYNLGVMEHFSEAEIPKILSEFYRVLKPGGRIVLFWPPEFGLSVLFFKFLKATLKFLVRKEYKFHPDEICRLQSEGHARNFFSDGSFKVLKYSFGPRDLFTYSIVVAEKPV